MQEAGDAHGPREQSQGHSHLAHRLQQVSIHRTSEATAVVVFCASRDCMYDDNLCAHPAHPALQGLRSVGVSCSSCWV